MNRNAKIVVVTVLGIVALVVTSGWSVLAGAAWPPEPYQEYSPAGSWTDLAGGGGIVVISPPDAKTGTGSAIGILNNVDPTFGGLIPEATSVSPWFYTYVRTGPNTYHVRGLMYVKKDGRSASTILNTWVFGATSTHVAPDLADYTGTVSLYRAAADKNGDDQPDLTEAPVEVYSITGRKKRI
jgi:hypothetical protein